MHIAEFCAKNPPRAIKFLWRPSAKRCKRPLQQSSIPLWCSKGRHFWLFSSYPSLEFPSVPSSSASRHFHHNHPFTLVLVVFIDVSVHCTEGFLAHFYILLHCCFRVVKQSHECPNGASRALVKRHYEMVKTRSFRRQFWPVWFSGLETIVRRLNVLGRGRRKSRSRGAI